MALFKVLDCDENNPRACGLLEIEDVGRASVLLTGARAHYLQLNAQSYNFEQGMALMKGFVHHKTFSGGKGSALSTRNTVDRSFERDPRV